MVKHGRKKKQRAGRIGKTKLKNRSWVRWDPKPKLTDPVVKKHWDVSKSPSANLSKMGLAAKPNEMESSQAPKATETESIVELFDVPDSDRPSRRTRFPLEFKLEEEKYICRCMQTYGDDYAAMFRDIKVNNMQYTKGQLRRMGARFLLLTREQRRVEVPDKVKDLLPEDDSS